MSNEHVLRCKAKYVKMLTEQGKVNSLILGSNCPSDLGFGDEKCTKKDFNKCSKCWGVNLY